MADLSAYRSPIADIGQSASLAPLEQRGLRCPACGRRENVSWLWPHSLILNHGAARCSWWRRLLGCRERRPHFHIACVCGERWVMGHAAPEGT